MWQKVNLDRDPRQKVHSQCLSRGSPTAECGGVPWRAFGKQIAEFSSGVFEVVGLE
jgi:hypothetical protein